MAVKKPAKKTKPKPKSGGAGDRKLTPAEKKKIGHHQPGGGH